jgi:hypothetical protein
MPEAGIKANASFMQNNTADGHSAVLFCMKDAFALIPASGIEFDQI